MLNRTQDIARIESVKAALRGAIADSMVGLDCRTASDSPVSWLDPQAQREADLLEFGDDDLSDPAYRDWCIPAKLQYEMAPRGEALDHLRENDPHFDPDDPMYMDEGREANKHDRPMMDVPKDGHRKGGTHAVAPEKRRTRNAKIVNSQLLPTALIQIPGEEDIHELDRQERQEADAFQIGAAARIARNAAYVLSVYKGKYRAALELLLQGKTVPEIAAIVGKTSRRIQQIVHGNASKGRKPKAGLIQIIQEILEQGVPADFQSPAPELVVDRPVPVVVQPMRALKKSLQKAAPVGQLGWDWDALSVEVAA